MISITYFSNFLNSHQLPVAIALSDNPQVDYSFVSLQRSEGVIGRDCLDDLFPFVVKGYEAAGSSEAMRLTEESDIAIFGDVAGREEYVSARAKTGRPFFRDSERLLKRGQWWRYAPPKIWRTRRRYLEYSDDDMRVLCASAFTSADLDKFGFPSGRCLKWGYFPEVRIGGSRERSCNRDLMLCSAQRLIPCKHVELQLNLINRLKQNGVKARLILAGDGPEMSKLKSLAKSLGIADRVDFLGQLNHREVLEVMASSDVFLATSDRREGWGATVNEAMASGCVVIGSSLMGSVPFLIRDGVDGFIFESGNIDSLEAAVLRLVGESGLLQTLSQSAIKRATSLWSSENAASRLVAYCEALSIGEAAPTWDDGPMSEAYIKEDNWFVAKKTNRS